MKATSVPGPRTRTAVVAITRTEATRLQAMRPMGARLRIAGRPGSHVVNLYATDLDRWALQQVLVWRGALMAEQAR